MSKESKVRRESRKKAQITLKERRARKLEKKHHKQEFIVNPIMEQ